MKIGMGASSSLFLVLILSVVLLTSIISFQPFAYADDDDDDNDDHDDIICANAILGGVIDDNVRVSFDSWCQFERAIVNGNVFLEDQASLDIFDSTINGNIKGPETSDVYLSFPSFVKGNILVDGVVIIEGVDGNTLTVDGNVKSKGLGLFRMWDSVIKGNVDVKQKNMVDIINSSIDGNLKVKKTIGGTFFTFIAFSGNVNLDGNDISKNVEVKEFFTSDVIITGNNIERNLDVKDSDDDDDDHDDNGNVNVEKSLNKIFLIISNIIGGHLHVKDNIGKSITVESNAVNKDLDVKDNTSVEGITVKSNVVEKDFDVKDNTGETAVDFNVVGKDMKVEKNGNVSVTNNDIKKDLEIKKNGICTESGNDVKGKRKIKNC